jgi:hypothetical protein
MEQDDEEILVAGARAVDPLTGTVLGANYYLSNPRLYFLWIWQTRIAQILKEWDGILSRVDRTVS